MSTIDDLRVELAKRKEAMDRLEEEVDTLEEAIRILGGGVEAVPRGRPSNSSPKKRKPKRAQEPWTASLLGIFADGKPHDVNELASKVSEARGDSIAPRAVSNYLSRAAKSPTFKIERGSERGVYRLKEKEEA